LIRNNGLHSVLPFELDGQVGGTSSLLEFQAGPAHGPDQSDNGRRKTVAQNFLSG